MFYHKISLVEFSKLSSNSASTNKITKNKQKDFQVKVTRVETNDINPQMCKLLPYESQFFIQKPSKRKNKKLDETRNHSTTTTTTNIPSLNFITQQTQSLALPSSPSVSTRQTTLCEFHQDGDSSSSQMSIDSHQNMNNLPSIKRPIIRTSISIQELLN